VSAAALNRGRALATSIALLTALAGSCRTVPRAGVVVLPPAPPATLSRAPAQAGPASTAHRGVTPDFAAGPMIRVGILVDVPRASVGADGGVVVQTGDGQRSPVARATFLPRSGGTAATQHRFSVQVGSLADETAARVLAGQAGTITGLPASALWNPETRTFQVRVAGLASREQAQDALGRLARGGLAGAWVVDESIQTAGGRLRLSETGQEMTTAHLEPYRTDELLTVDGLPYRGTIEVRAGESGVTVVNILPLEDYLRGVVPNELSPSAFPEKEALKAQAVAARTYALANRGQFASRGYDICATPACQVYRGQSTETALSDESVQETAGVTASYRGGMINALYTSTCGGHTEDSANIFDGPQVAYLRGVACEPERSAWSTLRTSANIRSIAGQEESTAAAALLSALGVLEPGTDVSAGGAATEPEIRAWTGRLAAVLRRENCEADVEGPLTRRGTFLRYVVGTLCWQERERLLAPGDPDYLLQVEDKDAIEGDGEKLAAALLVKEGALTPFPDNTLRPAQAVTRAQAVVLLARIAERSPAPGLLVGTFRGASSTGISVETPQGVETHAVAPTARLFRSLDGMRVAASELSLAPGDKVRVVLSGDRVTYVEGELSRLGAAADRASKYYQWEVRMTPSEIEEQAARFGDVGRVQDVSPRRMGVSGRVVDLAIVGSGGDLLLHGLKIRSALGLRENLFVIDRERDRAGNVARFIFTGKGWGHGVGLCQVGAFGMAQSGATYEQILKHYYTGIALARNY
jgi:stage II sporulation protein D